MPILANRLGGSGVYNIFYAIYASMHVPSRDQTTNQLIGWPVNWKSQRLYASTSIYTALYKHHASIDDQVNEKTGCTIKQAAYVYNNYWLTAAAS